MTMPDEITVRLRDRRLNVWEQAMELAGQAAEDGRVFTPRELGTWDVLGEELYDLDIKLHKLHPPEVSDGSNQVVKRLRDRRLNLWEECNGLAEIVGTENRYFTPEELGKWEVLAEEMKYMDQRIKQALDAEIRERANTDLLAAIGEDRASDCTRRLHDRRVQCWEELAEIADRTAGENRGFSAEEDGEWHVLTEHLEDHIDPRLAAALEADQRRTEGEQAFARLREAGRHRMTSQPELDR